MGKRGCFGGPIDNMDYNKDYNAKQFELFDSIMNSINELIPLLETGFTTDSVIEMTVQRIFTFLRRVLIMLPDLMVHNGKFNTAKKELALCFDDVEEAWKNFADNRDYFFEAWSSFSNRWTDFSKMRRKINSTDNIFYLSLN